MPYFPMCTSSRDTLSLNRWALYPHLTFSPTLIGPKLWGAYLTAGVNTLMLPMESILFRPLHLQWSRPGKTCLNLGTSARPHLKFQPTCWDQTDPEIQLVSLATLGLAPTRPSAPRLETPYGGLHFRTSQQAQLFASLTCSRYHFSKHSSCSLMKHEKEKPPHTPTPGPYKINKLMAQRSCNWRRYASQPEKSKSLVGSRGDRGDLCT